MRKRLEGLGLWTLATAFVLFPFWWWYRVLTGRFDMASPMDDPYVSADDGPGVRQGLRYFGLTLWTLAALGLVLLLLQQRVRARRARQSHRGCNTDLPLG